MCAGSDRERVLVRFDVKRFGGPGEQRRRSIGDEGLDSWVVDFLIRRFRGDLLRMIDPVLPLHADAQPRT
jgi:hypothetical protein